MKTATKYFFTILPCFFLRMVHSHGTIGDQCMGHVIGERFFLVPIYGGRERPSNEVTFQVKRFVFCYDIRCATAQNDLKIA